MLRRSGLLVVLATAFLAGCSIDRVEWESTGHIVEAVTHSLEEEHQVEHPSVECIQREALGSVWECRAQAGQTAFHCKVHEGVRHVIHGIHCEQEHEEEAPAEH